MQSQMHHNWYYDHYQGSKTKLWSSRDDDELQSLFVLNLNDFYAKIHENKKVARSRRILKPTIQFHLNYFSKYINLCLESCLIN